MPALETTRLPEVRCLKCGYVFDAATGEGEPISGDVSICIECDNIAIFTDDLTLRAATEEEIREITSSKQVQDYMGALAAIRRKH